jgi:hypothetical protein
MDLSTEVRFVAFKKPLGVVALGALLLVWLAPAAPAGPAGRGQSMPRATTALVLRYTFNNDAGGIVHDASVNALHGTLVNADPATAYVASVPGKGLALSLVGAQHQFVDVPQSSVLDVNRFTLAALVRYTGVENDATNGRWEILEKAGAYWINVRTNGRVRVGAFFGSCTGSGAWRFLDSTRTIPKNTWTHVAGTYNGSILTIWINGARAGSMAVSGTTCSNDEPLAVGAKSAPAKGLLEAFWDGRLDEVRVYNRALTATEIAALVP